MKPSRIKAALDLLPARPLRAISAAFLDGATNYEPWDWLHADEKKIQEWKAALLRHVTSYVDPTENDFDKKSGLHHLAHAGATVMILLYHAGVDFVQPKKKDQDDV